MRELVFSVGLTFLTGILLFIYFRNKMNNIDKKVNMVFETIQQHNSRMQIEAQEEMKRFQMYQTEQMQSSENDDISKTTDENIEKFTTSPNNLIDVSDKDSDFSEESDSDSDSDVDETENKVLEVDNIVSELLNDDLPQINIKDDKKNVSIDQGDNPLNVLQIMEEKLDNKSLGHLVNYNKFTKSQLRNICEEKGYTGWKSLNKGNLVTFLEKQ